MSQNLVLKFILLKFTQNSIPLYAMIVFYFAVSGDMKTAEAEWLLDQAEIKSSLGTHSSSVLSNSLPFCPTYWEMSVERWSTAVVPHPMHQEHYSTKFRNARFTHHNDNWTYQWRHKHKWPSIILEGSPGLSSIINCHGIYGCFAVLKSMIVSWLHFQLWVQQANLWKPYLKIMQLKVFLVLLMLR